MIFKDRSDAAIQLAHILKDDSLIKTSKNLVVVSLLRGGAAVGKVLSDELKAVHVPLAVAKIPAPGSNELAIGAICFDITFLEKYTIHHLGLNRQQIIPQIGYAREKFERYVSTFHLNENMYEKSITGKTVILTDDGIATGATVKAACLFLRTLKPAKLILAVPVAPAGFEIPGFEKIYILHWNADFSPVSHFYEKFPQVGDDEVKRLLI